MNVITKEGGLVWSPFLRAILEYMNDLEKEVKDYLVERNWYGLEPANMAKSVMIEGAELLEIFQWKNYTAEEINANDELKLNIKKELADVMIYAIELAVHLDIDVSEAVRYKLEHNRKKYTVEGVTNKESGKDFYKSQKMEYRSRGE